MSEYLPFLNLVLNALILPLLAMQWRTRVDIASMNGHVVALAEKVTSADAEIKKLRERVHHAMNEIAGLNAVIGMRKSERGGK